MSDFITAFILGIVEGLTEFLPVSSTGHLIIAGHIIGFTGEKASAFEVFIQAGAILAVVVLYFRRFTALFDFSSTGASHGFSGVNGLVKLGIATFPVLLLGFVLHGIIKHKLFSPATVAYGLIVGGIVMLLIDQPKGEKTKDSVEMIDFKDCFIIGVIQCLALWPGVSRSGATIVGGLLTGLTRRLAAEFSFILAVPALFAAVAYDLYKNLGLLSLHDAPFFLLGFFVSFVVAILAIKFFLRMVQTFSFRPFAFYRMLIGVVVLVWLV